MKSANYGKSLGEKEQSSILPQPKPSNAAAAKSPLDNFLAGSDAQRVASEQANQSDEQGQTPLHLASYNGDIEEITRLISIDRINLNPQEFQWGDTPLHKAVCGGHVKAVSLLLVAGARVDIGNKKGELALHYAADQGLLEITSELIIKMKASGISLDTQENAFGDTALHKTANSTHEASGQIARALISAGAKASPQNNKGETPAHYAAYKLKANVINAIGESGDECNTKDGSGYLPIHKITEVRNVSKAEEESLIKKIYATGKSLIDAKADVNGRELEQKTAISNAAWNKDLFGIIVLRLLGADVNITDKYGCLPISKPEGEGADKAKIPLNIPQEHLVKLAKEYHLTLAGQDAGEASEAAAHS